GPPVGRPVAVKVLGDDLEILNRLAGKVAEKLESIQGVKDIEHDFRLGKQEIQIVVDGDRAALYGLDVETIARTIRLAYKGEVATTFNDSNEEIDVVVTFNQATRNDRGRLLDIKIKNPAGALIPLKNVAAAAHTSGYATIKRFDGKRVITVLADIDPALNTSRTVISEIRRSMAGYMKQFPGYKLTFGGEFENTQKSLASMFQAFGLATFLIYLILATTFKSFTQPLLLMASIPFAVLGVFIGLIVTQTPMGMMSFMGTIALAGIVVNDSIVLIDVINRRIVEAGPDGGVTECLIDACKTRLRPVLLTSITTILGLMPLAMGIFGREFMMTPMAISIVWGLSFSSFLTLLIIPCFYLMLEDAKRWLASLPGMKRRVPATGILDEESQG
ncbi:MAG: efflux RND transporter permease subunit, partial [Deltaproteobacteria bacterium]|nr:efflux RND transporter permease subunit [Deltaproteobacteria bacterium]